MKKWYLGERKHQGPEVLDYRPKMLYEGGEYWSLSTAYNSREELFADNGLSDDLKCIECGGYVKTKNWFGKVGDSLKKRKLCFSCNHYFEAIETAGDPRRVIINGSLYWRKDWNSTAPSHCLGFSGSVHNIKMNSGEIYKTNDLWFNGDIPERFKDRLKDNAVFIQSKS